MSEASGNVDSLRVASRIPGVAGDGAAAVDAVTSLCSCIVILINPCYRNIMSCSNQYLSSLRK
jgi:hypothetical protein